MSERTARKASAKPVVEIAAAAKAEKAELPLAAMPDAPLSAAVETVAPSAVVKPAEIKRPSLSVRQPAPLAEAASKVAEVFSEAVLSRPANLVAQAPEARPKAADEQVIAPLDIGAEPITFVDTFTEWGETTGADFSASLPEPLAAEATDIPFDWEAFDAIVAPNYALLQTAPEGKLSAAEFANDNLEDEALFNEDLVLAYDWLGLQSEAGTDLDAGTELGVDTETVAEPAYETGAASLVAETHMAVRSSQLGEQIDQQRQELEPEAAELVDQTLQQLNEMLRALAPEPLQVINETTIETAIDELLPSELSESATAAEIEPEIAAEQLAAVTKLCVRLLEQLSRPTDEITVQALIGLLAPELAELFKAPVTDAAVTGQPSDEGTHEILLEGVARDNDNNLASLVDRLKLSWYGSIASRNQLAA